MLINSYVVVNTMMNQTCVQTFIEQTELIEAIETVIERCLQIEINARLTLDYQHIAPFRTFLTIPYDPDQNTIISNLARLLELTITPYIAKARPGDVLFDVKKTLHSSYFEQLVKSEIKKAFNLIEVRKDLAGRVLSQVAPIKEIQTSTPQLAQFIDTIQKGLDIHLGFKLFFQGNEFINQQLYLPVSGGNSIIGQIYTNIEKILIQNFSVFDEMSDRRIPITEGLIFKELLGVLTRISKKPKTRKKILKNIDNLQDIELFETVSEKEDLVLTKETTTSLINDDKLDSAAEEEILIGNSAKRDRISSNTEDLGLDDPVIVDPPQPEISDDSLPEKRKKLIRKKIKRKKTKSIEEQAFIDRINAGKSFKEDDASPGVSGTDLSQIKKLNSVEDTPLPEKRTKKKKLIKKKIKRKKTKSIEEQAYIDRFNAGKSLEEDHTSLSISGVDDSITKTPDSVEKIVLPKKRVKKKKLIRKKRKCIKNKANEDQTIAESNDIEKGLKDGEKTHQDSGVVDLSFSENPDIKTDKSLSVNRIKKKKLVRKKIKRIKPKSIEGQASVEEINAVTLEEKKSKQPSQTTTRKKIKAKPLQVNKPAFSAIITFDRPKAKNVKSLLFSTKKIQTQKDVKTGEIVEDMDVAVSEKNIARKGTKIKADLSKPLNPQVLREKGNVRSKKVKHGKENHLFLSRSGKKDSIRSALFLDQNAHS